MTEPEPVNQLMALRLVLLAVDKTGLVLATYCTLSPLIDKSTVLIPCIGEIDWLDLVVCRS